MKGELHPADILREYALSFLGLPYLWGGDDPVAGFDCSGLALELLWSQGIGPKHDTTAHDLEGFLLQKGYPVAPQFGAFAFYGRKDRRTHVAFCLSQGLILEAGGGGSRTTDKASAIQQNAYVRIRPLKHRNDLQSVIMPDYDWVDFIGKG